ncbi:MAG: GTPase Era [Pseudanabaenaceae cyanobacterium SKYGB_i_bin29]|nr:GTPase Era [Pseudanabaenaceae cyanobacterium SKYG29]MDW8422621.1 GTPase Era [Pseudanabaenaceae cyanobacterium SKYGB_i_bin29]
MTNFRSGFVALVGRPNVGKSTLLNALVGQKIAITSPVAQTTRHRLRGILTLPQAQIIFVDTPGIHKPHHLLGTVLVENATKAIKSVDVVVLVVDGSVALGRGDQYVFDLIQKAQVPYLIGINKIDQAADSSTIATYQTLGDWVTFSALQKQYLDRLQTAIWERLPPGPLYYPADMVTDQPERFIMAELIREQILLHTREEVPHSVAVTIDRLEERPELTAILATIYVERPSQKAIIIGEKGQKLKTIGSLARQQIQKLIMGKVYLELFVKVQPKWRSSRLYLKEFGYHSRE